MGRAKNAARETGAPNHFGGGIPNEHRVVDGGTGTPVEAMAARPMEAGYVPPEERSNPDYLAKLAKEKADREKSEGVKKAFGIGVVPQLFGASPNSPQGKVNVIY